MQFYKQTHPRDCQVIALQTVLSFYNLFPTPKEIKQHLPKHTYGNTIIELASYLRTQNIDTKLITNNHKPNYEELDKYEAIGIFEDRLPIPNDIQDRPVIINVDGYKVKSAELKQARSPHYVVTIRENNVLMLYDRDNYSAKIETSFEFLFSASKDINRLGHNGMWLVC